MNPSPTPYDIWELPVFAFQPGLWWWLVPVAIALCFLLIARLLRPRPGPKLQTKMFAQLELALNDITAAPVDKVSLQRASRILRTLIGSLHGTEIGELSGQELRDWGRSQSQAFAGLVDCLLRLEDFLYAPPASLESFNPAIWRELLGHVADYRRQTTGEQK